MPIRVISDLGPNVLSDRQVVIPLGDLEKDKPQSVLFELIINPRQAGLFRIGQAELIYDVPIWGIVKKRICEDIKVTFTNDNNRVNVPNVLIMNLVEKVNAPWTTTHAE